LFVRACVRACVCVYVCARARALSLIRDRLRIRGLAVVGSMVGGHAQHLHARGVVTSAGNSEQTGAIAAKDACFIGGRRCTLRQAECTFSPAYDMQVKWAHFSVHACLWAYMRVYVYLWAYMRVCMCVLVGMHARVCVLIGVQAFVCGHVGVHACVYVCACGHACVCMCAAEWEGDLISLTPTQSCLCLAS